MFREWCSASGVPNVDTECAIRPPTSMASGPNLPINQQPLSTLPPAGLGGQRIRGSILLSPRPPLRCRSFLGLVTSRFNIENVFCASRRTVSSIRQKFALLNLKEKPAGSEPARFQQLSTTVGRVFSDGHRSSDTAVPKKDRYEAIRHEADADWLADRHPDDGRYRAHLRHTAVWNAGLLSAESSHRGAIRRLQSVARATALPRFGGGLIC